MKKILFLLLTLFTCQMAKSQVTVPRQEIHYNVNYHWGLIDVMIARGVVTFQSDTDGFYGTLDGTSIPWEGKIICVSDTLRGNLVRNGQNIVENVDYQSGWYRHIPVSLFRSASYNPDDPAYFKNIAGGGEYDASGDSMEAITVTSDMIGMYYLAHVIEFQNLKPGNYLEYPINGRYADKVVVTYQGEGVYNANGISYPTYNCSFEYSYGGRMSGYSVQCQISVSDRIPVSLSASLPVGHVEMLYDP